jgi:hypothetical protein
LPIKGNLIRPQNPLEFLGQFLIQHGQSIAKENS